jgi:type IV secretory pathway VirB2 component (pilin)
MQQLAGHDVDHHDALDIAGRVGLMAYGVVHLVIAWLALQLAFGDREGSASSTGAVQQLAEQPLGGFLVWAVAIGMFLLAIWRVLDGLAGEAGDDGSDRAKAAAAGIGKAVLYTAIGVSAVKVATGSGSSSKGSTSDSMTATVMEWPGGQLLVGAAGLAVIGYGCWLVYVAWSERFLKKIDGKDQSGNTGTAFKWFGKAGYAAKGVAVAVIGSLFVYAAATHEAKKSGGLDQALLEILDQPFGPVLLTLVAVGIAAYGLFAFARAKQDSPS